MTDSTERKKIVVTLSLVLLLVCVVLLVALGCAGADWFIHGHKSLVVALSGFAAACWVASGLA